MQPYLWFYSSETFICFSKLKMSLAKSSNSLLHSSWLSFFFLLLWISYEPLQWPSVVIVSISLTFCELHHVHLWTDFLSLPQQVSTLVYYTSTSYLSLSLSFWYPWFFSSRTSWLTSFALFGLLQIHFFFENIQLVPFLSNLCWILRLCHYFLLPLGVYKLFIKNTIILDTSPLVSIHFYQTFHVFSNKLL